MSSNRIVWEGLDELKAALRTLPAELAAEAAGIVTGAAERAKQDIASSYPERTGNLRKSLTLSRGSKVGRFGTSRILKNNSKIAWIYDNGSQARHYITKAGKKHETGKMWGQRPPTHLFVGTVIRQRRAMYERLKELLTRHGLQVSGDA